MAPRKATTSLSADHKAALAEGRSQGRAVRRYLEALDAHRPKRGRRRTPESIRKRLERIETEVAEADPLKRLMLTQERIDLEQELGTSEGSVDLEGLEGDFVAVARSYGDRKGISYTAWRGAGVPASVLRQAGIGRGSG